ncbi:ubiquinone biosynthesis protein [Pseudovirgaria hyperparasitica]|uniref:Ubiquinone biosynthesis protein n=1 Tax=Pseudovirgaria hyperparasitica TaxID=470096 RepID=A0A6A6WA87_9PEZI|nr:ubiquinone biosynthesis protein [Pseudovirgaria hyperparasitica]KAF2759772.1 ubiquinone biosynthesis protein [Pseudovirgaria hyperparasitica]
MSKRPLFTSLVGTSGSLTCRACLQQRTLGRTRQRYSTVSSTIDRAKALPTRTKQKIAFAALGGAALVTGAWWISDDVKHTYRAARRTGRVARTLILNIYDYRKILKLEMEDQAEYSKILKECHQRCANRTLDTIEKNGSIFIKLGQHLTSLTYLLPSEWCDTFIPLQDKCPVSSIESIREMIRQDTGEELSDYFSEFEERPLGAASLAQVHRATIKESGQKVAVKVQHPLLDEWAPLDLSLTSFTFSTLKYWFPEYDLTWLSEEMQVSLPQELNFELEGKNAMRARRFFADKDYPLLIPEVLWAKRRILVMEYLTGRRPDDLDYLDSHNIDRDEVSAALSHIFNEMIFGKNAPLHCDPHGGNLAIRHNPNRRGKKNFDVILYDHGLYRDIPIDLRRSYAKLWLAVLESDEAGMKRYAHEAAGIEEEDFHLFASAITGRDYSAVKSGLTEVNRSEEEKEKISDALGEDMLLQLVRILGQVPRVILLILKTNDLTRSLDEHLHTRHGPLRTFLILARYASRTVYEEQLEQLRGSLFWPSNWMHLVFAWSAYARTELKLSLYERWLGMRAFWNRNRWHSISNQPSDS